MITTPDDYRWLAPWNPLDDEGSRTMVMHGQMYQELTNGEPVGLTLEEELYRELPDSHVLSGMTVRALAFCDADPNEFLFSTDSVDHPFACVHLTWSKENDPNWPMTYLFSSLEDWTTQMKGEHGAEQVAASDR